METVIDKNYALLNIRFNISKRGVVHLSIKNNKENEQPFFRVINEDDYLIESINYSALDKDSFINIDNRFVLQLYPQKNIFKIFDKVEGKYVVESNVGFLKKAGDNQVGISLQIRENEKFIGMGQDVEGKLYLKDIERRCWNEWNGYDYLGSNSVPFYFSNKGYGLMLDTTYPSRFVFGKGDIQPEPIAHEVMAKTPFDWNEKACPNAENEITILAWEEPIIDIYFFPGNIKEISDLYYKLAGHPTLIPKWSLGYIQCKNRYKSEKEIWHIAKKMRDRKIPCDVVVVDWLWFKEFGDLYWDGKNYTDKMKETIAKIKEMGIKILLAVHPFVDYASVNYKKLNELGCVSKVPEGGRPYFDHTNPATKEAMWKFYQKLYDEGIAGWWTDMGEPESDLPGSSCYVGKREKYHNVYTLLWSKNIKEAQKEHTGSRNFCLARTNALGIQNYNTAYWTGDIFATWEIYRRNIKASQTVSLTGQPYVCSDIGGFHTDDRFTPELYIRWLQWGIFSGLFRVHGVKPENEPWSLGEENEKILTNIIRLRYSLISYIYSWMQRMGNGGDSLIRPMIADYPNDDCAIKSEYQFFFGDFLVCPIIEEGCREIEVYLPTGTWFDYDTGQIYEGQQTIKVYAPIDKIPLFVKDGTIIVLNEDREKVEKSYDSYEIRVYGDKKAETTIYEDDGESYAYEKGEYNIIKIIAECGKIDIINEKIAYDEAKGEKKLLIKYFSKNSITEENLLVAVSKEGLKTEIDFNSKNFISVLAKDLIIDFDVSRSHYNGTFVGCLSINNRSGIPSNLRIGIKKPKSYFVKAMIDLPESLDFSSNVKVEESAETLYRKVFVDTFCKVELPFIPFKNRLPQQEEINIEVQNQKNEEIIYSKNTILGNGYIKNWRYAVSKYDDVDKENLNYQSGRDHNPWGYIYLYQYLNMQENGICPVDFIEIIQKIGFAYAKVNILSPTDKTGFLRIRADEGSTFVLNEKEIYKRDGYTIEEEIPVNLKKGENLLEAYLNWRSPRPFTGREFGLSVQFINEENEIDPDILCY